MSQIPVDPVERIRSACRQAGLEAEQLVLRHRDADIFSRREDFTALIERQVFFALAEINAAGVVTLAEACL